MIVISLLKAQQHSEGEHHSVPYQGRESLCSAVLTEVEVFEIIKVMEIFTVLGLASKLEGDILTKNLSTTIMEPASCA